MRWSGWLAVLILSALLAPAVPQQTPSDVVFGGEYFFRLRASAGGLSPEERAAALQVRFTLVFTRLLAQGKPLTVRVHSLGAVKSISVADIPFVTVTAADAEANQMTVEQLANVWANNLDQGLRRILSESVR
ncbi:hypothetical protein Q2T83_14970 [Fervidibacter sacchari]|uniref:Curli production assembly/transport component CsgE n=1 Tax=Candidatus Fervidibacter sacchari TaxID=1448929 RepID=A0ABT2EK16_9BACT|nr:hypothetical protein [Candidatus Fervidibacter sacchari]MCS3917801.1 hypothetical protein [Candidatus Fervidibacter sacchari]WKU15623.1 hypothetical protein Q2T83_14970 [Candidatus Fervidibacter sacchari]